MKPNFALSLSFDGIRLLHRATGGWHFVGDVSVSDPDLTGALAGLLADGTAVEADDIRSKLIIPDEQIKYLTIDTPDMDVGARRIAAASALDGATPYAVDALAYDISSDGARTHIAAVARETLSEAEAFAKEHGFEPVSFVAAATGTDFLGEPFFGTTAHSETILDDGIEVEPDGVRVVIVDNHEHAVPQDTAIQAEIEQAADVDEPVAPPSDADRSSEVEPEQTRSAHTEDTAEETPASWIPTPPEHTPQDETNAPFLLKDTSGASEAHADVASEAADWPDEAETATDTTALDAEVSAPPLLGFATRRRQDPTTNPAPARLGGVSRTGLVASPTAPVRDANATPPPTAPAIDLETPPKSISDSLRPSPLNILINAKPTDNHAGVAPEVAQVDAPPQVIEETLRPGMGGVQSRPETADPIPEEEYLNTARRGAQGDTEAARMTVFGARDDAVVGGKPRFLGLILVAVLLVFLAGIAVWATKFMDDGLARMFQGRERTLASTLPDDARDTLAQDVGATTELELDREAATEGVVIATLNDNLSDDGLSAEDVAVLDALRDPLPAPVPPEELDAAELEARYAVTGIWPVAPDVPFPVDLIDIEDLYVTGIDPVSPALDAVALPTLASLQTDGQLALVTSPAAAGTNFARGADGILTPTPEGTLSPDGFTVFLGRPPAVPPATTLVRFETDPDADLDRSALAQVRPLPRPADLIEQNERATLGGLSRIELAGLRPRLRPEALQEIAQDTLQAQTQDAETAPEEIEEAVATILPTAPILRPETRPRNFDRIVTRTQRDAPAAASTVPTTRTASLAPRTVTPAIPSAASVTRSATVRNAINLRQVNLIGVYGTPSNRRALVRLSNGRYQKVEVGDRFDGGRVSAIGDSELRYQKGARNLVLKMPQG